MTVKLGIVDLAFAAALALLLFSGVDGCSLPTIGPSTPPLVVMLHESQHGPLPPYALGAANELTAAGREVRPVDDDLVTGLGTVPTWLAPALEQGRAIMGGSEDAQQKDDALVLLSGSRVVKAIKLPATKEAILAECK